jgi:hypothetical protein
MVFPTLGLAVLNQHATPWQGTAYLLSAALKCPLQVFEFKMISFMYFKECTYLLKITYIQIFRLIFLKICGRAAALQLLQVSCLCLLP